MKNTPPRISASLLVTAITAVFLAGCNCSSHSPGGQAVDAATRPGGSVGGARATGGSAEAGVGGVFGLGGTLVDSGKTGAGGTAGTSSKTGNGGAAGTGGAGGAVSDGGPQLEAGVDTSKDVATDLDGPPRECLGLPGGVCATMVSGCASCPAGFHAHPTRAGCDEDFEWCCTKVAPAASDCTNAGGVCIANGAECPDKWTKWRTSCGTEASPVCCMRETSYCPAFPQACVDIGGVCTETRWGPCPLGMEIYALGDDQLGCEDSLDGWCCIDAPPSSCADSGRGMCVPGECSGCFLPVEDPSLTCEAGRSCCVDMCR